MTFTVLLTAASVLAGAIAAVAGFGIGSILTPIVALRHEMTLAVAAVAVPHFVATALRLWMMRRHVDVRVVKTFGVMSAAGGLTGALLQGHVGGRGLAIVFSGLLLFAGITGLTGIAGRMRFGRRTAWVAGIVSGGFGGLVGNQGGIRSAALLGFHLSPPVFVASATAVALMVDAARMPVYVFIERDHLLGVTPLIAVATAGVIAGTLAGERLLRRIPPPVFRKLVSGLVLALGMYMLARAFIDHFGFVLLPSDVPRFTS